MTDLLRLMCISETLNRYDKMPRLFAFGLLASMARVVLPKPLGQIRSEPNIQLASRGKVSRADEIADWSFWESGPGS